MNELTIAMPKGRIFEEAYQMLLQAGFNLPEEVEMSRKLMIEIPEEKFALFYQSQWMFLSMLNMVLRI